MLKKAAKMSNKTFLTNRAAMFGLDARISLIVFSAISLMTLSSFYGDITESNATQYLTDMSSVKQAYKNFRNDTNYDLTKNSNSYYYNIAELLSLTVDVTKPYTKKYKGPYIDYKSTGDLKFIEHPSKFGTNVSIVSRSFKDDWSSTAHPGAAACSADDCFKWLVFSDVPLNIGADIDRQVDGNADADGGAIRIINTGSAYDVFVVIESEK